MAKVVNLRQVRKARKREADAAQGNANAAKFGRTRAERDLEAVRAEKAGATLDGHRLVPQIRPATPDDLPAALAIIHAALRETVARHYSPDIIARQIASFDLPRLERLSQEARFWVAVRGEQVLAIGGWDGARIRTVFVHPQAQGQGIGHALMGVLLTAAGDTPARLVAQIGTQSFYERFGFRVTGEREVEGERTLFMERP